MLNLCKWTRLFAAVAAAALLVTTAAGVSPATAQSEGALALGKTVVGGSYTYDHVGQIITYRYMLQNTGTTSLAGPFTITDDKIGSFVCGGVSSLQGGGFAYTCNNPQQYTITQADIIAGSVTNTAFAASNDGAASNYVSVTVTFIAVPHITLTKSGTAPAFIDVGQLIQYTFVITNDGNAPLTPPYLIYDALIGSNWSCPSTPNPLPVNGTVTCTGSYALKSQDIAAGVVDNTATAAIHYGNAAVISSPASASVPIPGLYLQLTGSPTSITAVGQAVSYTYQFTNRTPTAMSNITVTDTRGATDMVCISALAAGATDSCTHTYTVTQTDFDSPASYFSNTATGTAQGSVNSNIAHANVTLLQLPSITLTKTGMAPDTIAPSQLIQYTFGMMNTGNVSLMPPYTISDPLLGSNWACPSTPNALSPGASLTCTGFHALSRQDILASSITNTATASAHYGAQTVTSNPSSAIVSWTPPQPPAVVSVTRASTSAFTSAASISFIVTFSAPVSGVNMVAPFSDFHLTTRGLTGTAITSVRTFGSSAVYQVTVRRGTGSGMMHLEVLDDDGIVDLTYGLPLGGTGTGNGDFTNGQSYWITPMPQSPGGTITNRTPTFKWTRLPGVTMYRVQLVRGTTVAYSIIVPSTVCGATTCSATPSTRLSPAKYSWRVQAFAAGHGRVFSPYKIFTLAAP